MNVYKNGIDEQGHPYSAVNDNDLFSSLTEEQQQKCLEWVDLYVRPTTVSIYPGTSYGLKHNLEDYTKVYMTNNQFKDLMLKCGYFPVNEHELNWRYRISKKGIKQAWKDSHQK